MNSRILLRAIYMCSLSLLSLSMWPVDAQVIEGPGGVAATSGACFQAHCAATLSNYAGSGIPSASTLALQKGLSSGGGSSVGLGCSTNSKIAACSYATPGPSGKYIRVFDVQNFIELSDTGTTPPFGPSTFGSAPIVLDDGGVIAADSGTVAVRSRPVSGVASTWTYVPKEISTGVADEGTPVSPVLVGSKIIFIAEKCPDFDPDDPDGPSQPPCGISTYKVTQDSTTGAYSLTAVRSFSRLSVTSGTTTHWYETLNTPTVDKATGRVYIVASELCFGCGVTKPRDGRLFVADVDKSSGAISNLTAIYRFPGPSGASPLLVPNTTAGSVTGNGIYFDGLAHHSSSLLPVCNIGAADPILDGSLYAACFYGLVDASVGTSPTAPTLRFGVAFEGSTFQAGAALDPRGDFGCTHTSDPGHCSRLRVARAQLTRGIA